MKDNKIKETFKQAQDAAKQENKAKNSAMEELDDAALDEIAGAGNPFANIPRVPTQPIDDNLRNNG